MRAQVTPSPTPRDFATLLPILREFAQALNLLIIGNEVVASADLPAASADLDGLVLVESVGATRNLIVYGNNTRTRLTGVSF